jgi:hypothetical protein
VGCNIGWRFLKFRAPVHFMVENRHARIKAAFADFDCSDESVWDSAVALTDCLHMQPAELSEKYELFAINKCGSRTSFSGE